MAEETKRPDGTEVDSNAAARIATTVFVLLLLAALAVSLGYFVYTVIIPGIAAGFAQFSAIGSQNYNGPMFR